MSVQVENEIATMEEAIALLMQHMPASKVARVLAAWQIGRGDYLQMREKLFAGETVDTVFERAAASQSSQEG
jgi:hypothetical protein